MPLIGCLNVVKLPDDLFSNNFDFDSTFAFFEVAAKMAMDEIHSFGVFNWCFSR